MLKTKKLKTGSLLALSVFFALSLTLSGCSKSTKDAGSSTAPEATKAATVDETAAPTAAPGEKVVLEMWVNKFEDYNANWFKKWVDEFNKAHANIQVNLTVVPGDAWDQKLKSAQAAGKAPDIVNVSYGNIGTSAAAGKIMALDDLMDPAVFADLFDNVNGFVSVKGKHYAYPMLVEPSTVLYYRKDMFTAAGLDPEKPPTTWVELIEDAKKLTKDGVFGLTTAGDAAEYSWTSWGMQMHFGHRAISDDWSKATVVDDGYISLVQFYKDLADAKVVPKQAFTGGYADNKAIGEGKAAMAIGGSWKIGQLNAEFKDVMPNIGIAVMPTPDADPTKPTSSLGGWTLGIDGKAKHPKEAAEVISWLMAGDPNVMVDFFRAASFSKFSPRKSVDAAVQADPEASKLPYVKMISENIVAHAVSEPTYPWEISFAVGSAIERSVLKGQDPKASLQQAEKEINDIIASKKLAGTNPQQ